MNECPNCGKVNKESSKFCSECGYKLINEDKNDNNPYEEYNPAYGKFTRKMEDKLNNSKLFDKLIDTFTPDESKLQANEDTLMQINRKWIESIEPVFLEVYDTIGDGYIKALFWIERLKLGGGGSIGATMLASVTTPTSSLSHSDAIKFYENLLNKVKIDLEIEMKKPNFDKREYYKKKKKEYGVENLSNMGVPRHLR